MKFIAVGAVTCALSTAGCGIAAQKAARETIASGEITVAQANKLTIESQGMLQSALVRGNANAVAAGEAERQRASEAMLYAGTQLLASSQAHTTNCSDTATRRVAIA